MTSKDNEKGVNGSDESESSDSDMSSDSDSDANSPDIASCTAKQVSDSDCDSDRLVKQSSDSDCDSDRAVKQSSNSDCDSDWSSDADAPLIKPSEAEVPKQQVLVAQVCVLVQLLNAEGCANLPPLTKL